MNYILDFADNLTEAQVQADAANKGITLIKQYGQFGNVYLGSADSEPSVDANLVSVVVDDPNGIQLLGVDVTLTDSTEIQTFDIAENQNWWKLASINRIDFDEPQHTHTVRGQRSTVYILDSGIKSDHPEFAGKDITLLHSFTGEFADTNGHGTAIASIIAGNTCALAAPKLKIVKIFQNGTPTLQSDLVSALDSLLNDFIANSRLPSVVNISWAIPYNEYINSKFQFMINQGMYIIASAGNSGQPIADVTPACVSDVVVVGSYNQSLAPSNFSNYTGGSDISYTANGTNYGELDGWAPGEQIWAANLVGTYSYAAGTSLSAAIASGAFAYNIDNMALTDDFNYDNILMGNNFYQSLKAQTFIKKDLLTLTGNYTNSINKIATYRSNLSAGITSIVTTIVPAGTTGYQYALNRTKGIKRITCNDNLPTGVEFSNYGVLSVTSDNIDEPFVKLVDTNLTVHFDDGITSNMQLLVYVTKQGYNKETLISEFQSEIEQDPVLNITLQTDAHCLDAIGSPFCSEIDCFAYCAQLGLGNGLCQWYGPKSGENCACICEG